MQVEELIQILEQYPGRTVAIAVYDLDGNTVQVTPLRVVCSAEQGGAIALSEDPETAGWYDVTHVSSGLSAVVGGAV